MRLQYLQVLLINSFYFKSFFVILFSLLIFQWAVVYSPQSPALDLLMEEVRKTMSLNFTLPFDTYDEMYNFLIENDHYRPLAGVSFDDSIEWGDEVLPTHLKFTMKFPGELRFLPPNITQTNPNSDNWQTNHLYPYFQQGGPRNKEFSTGGQPPGYYTEQFTSLQSSISLAFIKAKQEVKEDLPGIRLRRFPYPGLTIDKLLSVLNVIVSLIFFLSFLYPCINNVRVR